ncbi:PP2C family protein-serine/threonine phosphatase [Actinoplanes sp. NPDC051470]|uniref:PP2C family protein-serine/threonine phosphatase n=1 Tax=unclassified Actinoplanes TaxID=2626549 RepID=UPI0034396961
MTIPSAEHLWLAAFTDLLDRSHLFQADGLAPAVTAVLRPLGLHAAIYLVDDEQRALRPVLTDGRPAAEPIDLEGSLPGRVFTLVLSMPTAQSSGWWIPIVNGTDRLGVIEFTVTGGIAEDNDLVRQRCETMAGLIGHLVTVTAPKGDFLFQVRRARHPAPLLLRAGRVVRELPGGRRMPLGLDHASVQIGEETMEPGDRLLLYTDGVTEARDASGEQFGVHRLIDQAERDAAAGLPAPETLRRLAHAVAGHHDGPAADDATLLLAEWSPTSVGRLLP